MRTEEELQSGQIFDAASMTLGKAFIRFSEEISPNRGGARWEMLRLKLLARDPVAEVRLDRLQPSHLADWRDRRLQSVSGETVRREITIIMAVLEQCRREWRLISTNPLKDVRKPPAGRPRDQRITDDQSFLIVSALGYEEDKPITLLSQRVAIAFLLAIETAMRAGELISLNWDQVFLAERYVHLDRTKNGDQRDVPLSKRAVALFNKLTPENTDASCLKISSQQLDALFRKGRDRTGLREITFHDSRHEAITRLSRKLDVMALARIIGHRDLKSLMIYYNEHARDIASRLD
ncbi:MAG: hypothetical protein B7Y53_01770 [Halothiobacillus sp. 28-55-5]|nr:MAG: hypothetical protein B7Y53_01770 [Halothiobacillus sp. 28-55-5]